MRVPVAIASLALLPSVLLSAQVERITIRMTPAPNQTFHARTSMNMTMSVTTDGPVPGGSAMPSVDNEMKTVTEHTSIVGPTDAQGHYQARVVCDNATFTVMMNGKPMPASGQPAPGATPAELIGSVITFTYDDAGKVIDVAMNATMPANLQMPLKQMLTSVLGAAPPMTLSVGESATIPTQLTVPLPTSGNNAAAMTMAGETRYTLTSVTFDGADRIAHLKMAMTSSMTQSAPVANGGMPFSLETRTSSEGTSDVNVDRGIVLHSEQRMTIDATMQFDKSNAATRAMPGMITHGVATLSADLTK